MMLDLEKLMADPARAAFIKKETLCQVELKHMYQNNFENFEKTRKVSTFSDIL